MKTRSGPARVLAAAALMGVLFGVHLMWPGLPYPPNLLAQWIVRVMPGGVATAAIELLGNWALRLLAALTTAAFIAILAALFRLPALRDARPAEGSRRTVIRALAFSFAGGVAVAAGIVRALPRAAGELGGRLASLGPVRAAPTSPRSPCDAEIDAAPGITPEITPNPSFYVVDESLDDPDIDASRWRLGIHGTVAAPLTLDYEDLLSLPAVEEYLTLECISNRVAGRLMSNARWRGVPLADLLRRAGVDTRRGIDVVTRAVGGYVTAFPLARALDPRTLVAYGMNGRSLPRAHGFPARIIVPGLYGMKNCKWLAEIEVVDHRALGYWEERGWSDTSIVRTMSRIDKPLDNSTVDAGAVIAGVAFAGDRGVERVEVSLDGGRTWRPTRLGRALSGMTWRRWAVDLPSKARGTFDVMARAFDGWGAVQDSVFRSPHPSGASGIHRITVTVRDG